MSWLMHPWYVWTINRLWKSDGWTTKKPDFEQKWARMFIASTPGLGLEQTCRKTQIRDAQRDVAKIRNCRSFLSSSCRRFRRSRRHWQRRSTSIPVSRPFFKKFVKSCKVNYFVQTQNITFNFLLINYDFLLFLNKTS